MKIEHKICLIMAAIALILAVPIALATQHHANLLKVERAENKTLHLQLDTKSRELQYKNSQLEQLKRDNAEQQKRIDDQNKQIDAKAAAKQAAKLASMTTPQCETYRGLVAQYDWNVSTAMAIMQAESGCRAITPDNSAINYDGVPDYGLFQLHGIAVTDPAENVRIAYAVKYKTQGWGAWSTYKNGAYLRYL